MTEPVQPDEWMISVDDHVIEPPNVWVDRLPAKFREKGPRWISDEHGESWLFEDNHRIPVAGMNTSGAIWPIEDRPDMTRPLSWSEVPRACYDPKARIEAMNTHHEIAALCFPNMGGFAGSLFQRADDKELALACIEAYNDWYLEEWCLAHPGRFIGMALIPMWDAKLAAAEATRVIEKGARSVSFSMSPQNLGYPPVFDDHWAPLFSLMNEVNLPLCTHLGTGISPAEEQAHADMGEKLREAIKNNDLDNFAEKMMGTPGNGRPRRRLRPGASTSLIGARMGQDTVNEWLESGNFEKYPNLKLVLSENGVGWIPSVLSLADWTERMNRTAPNSVDGPMPSDLFRAHIYGCFIHEPITMKLLDEVGGDNVMIETDFPHTATNWPNSMEQVDACMIDVTAEARTKILSGNAQRVFGFVPAEPPVLEPAM